MYDFLDKIGLKAVLEAIKGKMPTTLPANGGNADTLDGMHASDITASFALKSLYGDTTINVGRRAGTTVGAYSTAEGYSTTASGEGSHAEGIATQATGRDSHAEGAGSIASGYDSHAGGNSSIASGLVSFSHGIQTSAQSVAEVAFGQYNISRHGTLFSIGDGTADDARHNAFEITTDGGKLHDKDIATTDLIPTELPANGGNADTVGLRYPNDFLGKDYVYPPCANYGFGADLNNYVAEYHGFVYNCENSPIAYDYGFLDVSFFDGTGFVPSPIEKGGVVLQKFSRIDNCVFTRMRYANVWSEWEQISTTPIKSTVISGTTDENGNMLLWAADNRKPLFFEHYDAYVIPFLSGDSKIYLSVHDANTKEKITNAPMVGTLYYVEM